MRDSSLLTHDTPSPFCYQAVLFDLYGTLIDETAAATPGALERLAECRGAKWGIVTSAGVWLAHHLIARAGVPSPSVLVTGDDVEHNKPAPDGYLAAAARLQVKPELTLVIEDTVGGIASARSAGMDVVAVLYGRASDRFPAATFAVGDLTKLRLHVIEGAVHVSFTRRA